MRLIAQTYRIEQIIERLDPDSREAPGKGILSKFSPSARAEPHTDKADSIGSS